jgi:hypothetical protein
VAQDYRTPRDRRLPLMRTATACLPPALQPINLAQF